MCAVLFAIEDTMIGGGIVGGVSSVLIAAYVIWDKVKTRRELAAREKVQLRQSEITVEAMASEKVADAWERLAEERKNVHERDVEYLRKEIESNKRRLIELESHKAECDRITDGLQEQNACQARDMEKQSLEIVELRAKINALEQRLKDVGSLPGGTDVHAPVK